jgi:hypothetical protein
MNREHLSLKQIYQIVGKDDRVTTWHMAICVAILFLLQNSGRRNLLQTSRKRLMEVSKIRSIVTYHKCIKDLVKFGYIEYEPSYDPALGSSIIMHIGSKSVSSRKEA